MRDTMLKHLTVTLLGVALVLAAITVTPISRHIPLQTITLLAGIILTGLGIGLLVDKASLYWEHKEQHELED